MMHGTHARIAMFVGVLFCVWATGKSAAAVVALSLSLGFRYLSLCFVVSFIAQQRRRVSCKRGKGV